MIEAEKLYGQLLELSFVKPPRPGSRGMFFLHDEMYDLVEKYVWSADWPDYYEQARLDRVVVDWYTELIGAYRERIREAESWQARGQLRRTQQLLYAERLYYQFDADPRIGYREYSHLDEEAIGQRELEWDTWLRNEALWFTAHRTWRRGNPANQAPDYPRRDPAWLQNGKIVRSPAVDNDCRRRWVSRYIARNEYQHAAHIAERLLAEPPSLNEPELYRGGLRIALATAQAFLGGEQSNRAVKNFDLGIQALQAVPTEHRESWLHPYLLGNAHLYKGLALRGFLSLKQAAAAYQQAIRYFRAVNYLPGLAEATNNRAYILARQGRLQGALSACNRGLRIRETLGDEYGIGLSLNTRGVIHQRLAHPVAAIRNSEKALAIFREIGSLRGTMMAQINLGRAYRRKARSPEWGQQDAEFEKGRGYLEETLRVQGPDTDMFYRVEALSELGCLYRDWVATLYEKKERGGRVTTFLKQAQEHLQKAVELTSVQHEGGMPYIVQHVDSLEDLARVHYWRAKCDMPCDAINPLEVAREYLEQAEGLARDYLRDQDELKLILGKVLFQRARLAQLEHQSTARIAGYYALAVGYVESYSLAAPELRKFVTSACDWLGALILDEAELAVRAMYEALRNADLSSARLHNSVETIVKPVPGVGWPQGEEASHG